MRREARKQKKMGLVNGMCEVETVQTTFRYWHIDF